MPKLPAITGQELIKALRKHGFESVRQRGSHVQLAKTTPGGKITFPVPVHAGKVLKPGTLHGILRLAGLDADELRQAL